MISREAFDSELWSFFEYLLGFATEGIHIKCFSLIDEEKGIPGKGEAYLYERITRKIVTESANELKEFAKEYVETGKLDQVEGNAKPFQESLKETLFLKVLTVLNQKLIDHIIDQLNQDKKSDSVFIMVSLYYAIYKNSHIPGYSLHPFYFKVFIPFLTLSQKKFPEDIAVYQKLLHKRLLSTLTAQSEERCDLTVFFEDESVKKTFSVLFAGILSVMNEEKDLTKKFFHRTHHLKTFHLRTFKMFMANGFYTLTNKSKRFSPKISDNETKDKFRRVRAVPASYISGIINSFVDRNFNISLELIISYYQSGKAGKFKKHLLKNYNRTLQDMNRKIWKEIRKVVKTQMQVCYRSKYLLRLVIHYVFDKSDADRKFWAKYIPIVERIIHHIYKDENEQFIKINNNLNQIIEKYKEAKLFKGTDWESFYADPVSKKIASHMIRTIVDQGRSEKDKTLPATWFANLVMKGIDETALLRYFIKGLKNI